MAVESPYMEGVMSKTDECLYVAKAEGVWTGPTYEIWERHMQLSVRLGLQEREAAQVYRAVLARMQVAGLPLMAGDICMSMFRLLRSQAEAARAAVMGQGAER